MIVCLSHLHGVNNTLQCTDQNQNTRQTNYLLTTNSFGNILPSFPRFLGLLYFKFSATILSSHQRQRLCIGYA